MPSASPPWESAREATYIESGRGGHISQLSRPLLRGATRVAVLAPGPMTVRALPAGGPPPSRDPDRTQRPRRSGADTRRASRDSWDSQAPPSPSPGPFALVPPCSRRDSRRAPELGDGVGMAMVELGEGSCREPPPLDAVHGGLPSGPVSVQDSHRSPMSPGKGSGEPGIPSPHFAAIVTR